MGFTVVSVPPIYVEYPASIVLSLLVTPRRQQGYAICRGVPEYGIGEGGNDDSLTVGVEVLER